ncbi:MAG: hypothetical protein NC133_02735 [Prevotella sp.]|nr:hypothetical protein [Prevotella sp.]
MKPKTDKLRKLAINNLRQRLKATEVRQPQDVRLQELKEDLVAAAIALPLTAGVALGVYGYNKKPQPEKVVAPQPRVEQQLDTTADNEHTAADVIVTDEDLMQR